MGSLTLDGRDVADVLIGEGLAAEYVCGETRCPELVLGGKDETLDDQSE